MRQKLRLEILKVAATHDRTLNQARAQLAIPLAQLGDWDGALRLSRNHQMSADVTDELWSWRASQLVRSNRWGDGLNAVGKIRYPYSKINSLFSVARMAVESGANQDGVDSASKSLRVCLLQASPILKSLDKPKLWAYDGYLWAKAGDPVEARGMFERAVKSVQDETARSLQPSKIRQIPGFAVNIDTIPSILVLEAKAGLFNSAVEMAPKWDEYLMSCLMSAANKIDDVKVLADVNANLPPDTQAANLYFLSMKSFQYGDKLQSQDWFDRATQLTNQIPGPLKWEAEFGAVYACHIRGDTTGEAKIITELKEKLARGELKGFQVEAEDLNYWPDSMDLWLLEDQTLGLPVPTTARIDEISAALQAAKPSESQFQRLSQVASWYSAHQQPEKLRPVALAMLRTARVLAASDAIEKKKESAYTNPNWPYPPRMLAVIIHLSEAGDVAEATSLAHEFAAGIPQREKLTAAIELIQSGFPQLADIIFDPRVEIPRLNQLQTENSKAHKIDWDLLSADTRFVAAEARFRGPEAPLRWYGRVTDINEKVRVLSSWIRAMYPEPESKSPYITVNRYGENSSF